MVFILLNLLYWYWSNNHNYWDKFLIRFLRNKTQCTLVLANILRMYSRVIRNDCTHCVSIIIRHNINKQGSFIRFTKTMANGISSFWRSILVDIRCSRFHESWRIIINLILFIMEIIVNNLMCMYGLWTMNI